MSTTTTYRPSKIDQILEVIDECLNSTPESSLNVEIVVRDSQGLVLSNEWDLPTWTPSRKLSAAGHPGYSDEFAARVLLFVEHGMQPAAAIQHVNWIDWRDSHSN